MSGMYCPVDGDEFQEGVTRCPEHDVELVEDQPVFEDRLSWIDRFNDRSAVRLSFLVFVAAAIVYALSGFVTALLYLLIQHWDWEAIDNVQVFQQVQSASFPVGIAALGALAGALLLRTYLFLSETGVAAAGSEPAKAETLWDGSVPAALMRLLFALSVVFALLWAGTGIATSRDQVEYQASFGGFGGDAEPPSDAFVTMATVNTAAYTGGVATLAIMGAGLMARTHARGRRRSDSIA